MIFNVIKASSGGFPSVNEQVKNGLRAWYVQQLHSLIRDHPDDYYLTLTAAEIMRHFGFHDDALKYSLKCLKVREDDDEFQSKVYGTVASVYAETQELSEALECHEKALKLKLKWLLERHPEVAAIYNNIALIYDDQGQHDKALKLFEKSSSSRLETLGENHADVGASYNNLANLYMSTGEPVKAIEYHTKSLELNLKICGENHPDTASCSQLL